MDERHDDHADVRCVSFEQLPRHASPPSVDGRGWPVIGRGGSHGRPAIAGLGRKDVFALAASRRLPPRHRASISSFFLVLVYPLLPLFLTFEIFLDLLLLSLCYWFFFFFICFVEDEIFLIF